MIGRNVLYTITTQDGGDGADFDDDGDGADFDVGRRAWGSRRAVRHRDALRRRRSSSMAQGTGAAPNRTRKSGPRAAKSEAPEATPKAGASARPRAETASKRKPWRATAAPTRGLDPPPVPRRRSFRIMGAGTGCSRPRIVIGGPRRRLQR